MALSHDIAAIILAAGFSRRMGQFKPLLPMDGQTVLQRVVTLYCRAGVTDIKVVVGSHANTIRSALAHQPVQVIPNPTPDKGMFSSVLTGVRTLASSVQPFFIHPVDIPLVRPHTLGLLIQAFKENPSPVAYPVFDGRRGHPPIIHGNLTDAIRSHDGSGGLRSLLGRFDSTALEVPVADQGIRLDMDTPQDYQRLSKRLARPDTLSREECRMLMEMVCKLPGPIVSHCHQVARVAKVLAEAVNAGAGVINTPLVHSTAMVHDVARHDKRHAAAGARLLSEMGFPAMAAIVAVHMDIRVTSASPLDEAQIVHLADKLVMGSRVVGVSQRFDTRLKKYGHDPKIAKKINQRRQMASTIQANLERTVGRTLRHILKTAGIIDGAQHE